MGCIDRKQSTKHPRNRIPPLRRGKSLPKTELMTQRDEMRLTHAEKTLDMLRYCRNVRPTWVKFNSKDTKESVRWFEVLSTKSRKRT